VSHKLFQDWKESKSSRMLWVSANPGCGKSVLAKHLVDSVLPTTESRTLCYFFFKDIEDQKSAVGALCCILHQLFMQKRILLSDTVLEQFDIEGEKYTSSFSELWNTLVNAAEDRNAGEIVCILDAIDECEDQGRKQLAKELCKLYATRRNFKLKFLLTSRPYGEIRQGFQPLEIPELPVIHLSGESDVEIRKISGEIDVFVGARVQDIRARLKLSDEEHHLLLQGLMRHRNRTYLWAYLTLDLIESAIDIDKTAIREATSQLPETVDDAYDRILSKSRNSKKAKKILHIVVAAARPLTLKEMALALVLRKSHRSYDDLDLRPEDRFSEHVRDICRNFVTIVDSRIYLLHQTAKEFLVKNNDVNSPSIVHRGLKWKYSLAPQKSHRIITRICIWYLLLEDFEKTPLRKNGSLSQYVKDHIFLDYSAKHWATHFRELQIKVQGAMTESVMRICDTNSKRCLTWFRIYWTSTNTDFPQGFTSLMMVSYLGLSTAVKHLLEMDDIDLNSLDHTYQRSALSWAAGKGFDVVVNLLINDINIRRRVFKRLTGKSAKIDSVDRYGRTPLSYAVWAGNVPVVKLLVKAGARADLKDKIGGTPLSYAGCNGYKEVIELLLKGDIQVDFEEVSKELLLSAAKEGHEDVVRLLLDTDKINLDARDNDGQTPVSWATRNGHEAIVKLLLATERVDVNTEDNHGWTPLSWATEGGCKDVVKLLLNAGAKADHKYIIFVSEPAPSMVHASIESIADPSAPWLV